MIEYFWLEKQCLSQQNPSVGLTALKRKSYSNLWTETESCSGRMPLSKERNKACIHSLRPLISMQTLKCLSSALGPVTVLALQRCDKPQDLREQVSLPRVLILVTSSYTCWQFNNFLGEIFFKVLLHHDSNWPTLTIKETAYHNHTFRNVIICVNIKNNKNVRFKAWSAYTLMQSLTDTNV